MIRKVTILCCAMLLVAGAAAQGLLERGQEAERKGLVDLAEGYYRQAADSSSDARRCLGLLLERKGHFSDAMHCLATADSTAVTMAHLSVCQAECGKWADAKRSAEKAVELAGLRLCGQTT